MAKELLATDAVLEVLDEVKTTLRRLGRTLANPSRINMRRKQNASTQPGSRTQSRQPRSGRNNGASVLSSSLTFTFRRQKRNCMRRLGSRTRETCPSSIGRLLPADEGQNGAIHRGRDHVQRSFACNTGALVLSVSD